MNADHMHGFPDDPREVCEWCEARIPLGREVEDTRIGFLCPECDESGIDPDRIERAAVRLADEIGRDLAACRSIIVGCLKAVQP